MASREIKFSTQDIWVEFLNRFWKTMSFLFVVMCMFYSSTRYENLRISSSGIQNIPLTQQSLENQEEITLSNEFEQKADESLL